MNSVIIDKKEFTTPAAYNELSLSQLLSVCRHLLTHNKLTPYAILMTLFNCSRGLFTSSKKLKVLKNLPAGCGVSEGIKLALKALSKS